MVFSWFFFSWLNLKKAVKPALAMKLGDMSLSSGFLVNWGLWGFKETISGTCFSVLTDIPGDCVSAFWLLLSWRALEGDWDRHAVMENSVDFPHWGEACCQENSAKWPATWKCVHFVDIISLVSTPREVSFSENESQAVTFAQAACALCHVRHTYGAWQGAPPLQGPFWRASANPASLMPPTSAPPFPRFLAESTN